MAEIARLYAIVGADIRGLQRGLGQAQDAVHGFGRVGDFVFGTLLARGIEKGISALDDLGREALNAYATHERLGMALESMVARELRAKDATLSMSDALAQSGPKAKEL